MFIYSGSKLESDIAELNSNLLKTDYQKSIEPYQNEISVNVNT